MPCLWCCCQPSISFRVFDFCSKISNKSSMWQVHCAKTRHIICCHGWTLGWLCGKFLSCLYWQLFRDRVWVVLGLACSWFGFLFLVSLPWTQLAFVFLLHGTQSLRPTPPHTVSAASLAFFLSLGSFTHGIVMLIAYISSACIRLLAVCSPSGTEPWKWNLIVIWCSSADGKTL